VFHVVVYLTTIDMLHCKIDRLDVIFVAPWSSNAFVQFVSGALGSYNLSRATPMQDGVRARLGNGRAPSSNHCPLGPCPTCRRAGQESV